MESTNLQLQAGKFYRTRDGRKAFVAYVGNPFDPENWAYGFGFIRISNVSTSQDRWGKDGRYWNKGSDDDRDLVAEWVEPKRVHGWVNVYPAGQLSDVHQNRQIADQESNGDRIAVIEIDILEGHGLEGGQ